MRDLKQKLGEAKAKYAATKSTLEEVRATYENGPKKNYSELKENLSGLNEQIKKHEDDRAAAKKKLAVELKKSNGAKTEDVKETLAAIRDADFMLEECGVLQQQLERNVEAERVNASAVADRYQAAYQEASYAWSVMNVFEVLAECGDRLCAAMAVRPVGVEGGPLSVRQLPKEMMLSEINSMLADYENDNQPYVSEIGRLDLGTLSSNERMSPARRLLAAKNATTA